MHFLLFSVYLVSSHDLRNVGDDVRLLALVGLRLELINTNTQTHVMKRVQILVQEKC